MAEAVETAIVDLAVKKLVSKGYGAINYVMDLESEVKRLENTRTLIEAALLDADSMSEKYSHTEQDTLEKLSCQLDRLVDLLDVRNSRKLQKQVMSGGNFTKELRSFFSASNQLVARFKDAREVENIKRKLNSIAIDHAMIGRICSLPAQARSVQRAESSHVVTNLVVGRDRERDTIVSMLCEDSVVVAAETLSVASIYGIGGIGKTTMAWYAYNDERMKRCFDVKFWVTVTQDFDIKKVLVEMITACGARELPHNLFNMEPLYHHFRRAIGGKKFLLVLDNIWDHVRLRQKWVDRRDLLSAHSAGGSRVLITTRDKKVAGKMGTVSPYMLGDLTEDDCWLLFQKIAFTHWHEPGVEAIGKEIAEMCPKVPLVIRSIGGLLAGKPTIQEWRAFRDDQLANFASYGRDIMHTLKFSYDQLDARLKLCVTYCILFPKGQESNFIALISYWIALGYVTPQYNNQSLEEAGEEYIINLINCGFFKHIKFDQLNLAQNISMHDVMYELILSIAGFKYKMVDSNTYEIDTRVRHLSFMKEMNSSYWEMLSSISKIKRLQSFIGGGHSITSMLTLNNMSFFNELLSTFECLKVLDLSGTRIEKLPAFVGELICLRYLNLSGSGIVKLPNSITRLVNLQSLQLNYCFFLEGLPRDMSKLVNLRHLLLHGSGKLRHMPLGLGNLTNLTTLDVFIVGEHTDLEDNIAGKLSDLNQLNNLRGELHIEVRRESKYVMSSEISAVNLKMKENLLDLEISFNNGTTEDERVLECLQPPCNLKVLNISGYGGERLPSWMMDQDQLERHLPNLVGIYITYCKACKHLCSLGRLPHLKLLQLKGLDGVEYMEDITTTSTGNANNIIDDLPPVCLFPSLETLIMIGMPKFKGW